MTALNFEYFFSKRTLINLYYVFTEAGQKGVIQQKGAGSRSRFNLIFILTGQELVKTACYWFSVQRMMGLCRFLF